MAISLFRVDLFLRMTKYADCVCIYDICLMFEHFVVF